MKFKKLKKRLKNRPRRLDKFSGKGASRKPKAVQAELPEIASDPFSTKKSRGRPSRTAMNLITGHAYDFRVRLAPIWPELEGPLLAAKTEEEVRTAIENHAKRDAIFFVPEFASDILALIRDPKFPKRREARIKFLADSLGGRPNLSFRRSRDICGGQRAEQSRKTQHHILRHEFYVECSCGYKGPARDGACRKCGAEIGYSLEELMLSTDI